MKSTISVGTIRSVAQLAQLPITDEQAVSLQAAFIETIATFKNLGEVDVAQVEPTSQVTGQENVWREDVVSETTMLSQHEALQAAKKSHDGFFVVERVINEQ